MAYLLFIDESGHDRQESPYEVLAGAAIHDARLWDLVCDIQDAEEHLFGRRIRTPAHELKATSLLGTKSFRHANQMAAIPPDQRAAMAADLLRDSRRPSLRGLTAYAQAKHAYARRVLELCGAHGVRLFASIVPRDAPRPQPGGLRKDYGYLFERFYYFVEEQADHEKGLVVFDELERTRSHILVSQMSRYFRDTATGIQRSGRIVPEPFFVHSDLTTGIQIADLAAYVISWNVRVKDMDAAARPELDPFGRLALRLRHRAIIDKQGYPSGYRVWSFAVIPDLRTRVEKVGEQWA